MVTRSQVVRQIMAHLNMELTEADLVQWADEALVALLESDTEDAHEQALLDVLTYLAAGDSPGFPLSWSVLSGLLGKVGVTVRVVPRERLDLPT